MSINYYYFIICLLIPRIYSQWNDDEYTVKKTVIYIFIPEILFLLPLFMLDNLWIYISMLVFYHTLSLLLRKTLINIYLRRIIEIFVIVIACGFIFGTAMQLNRFNPISKDVISWIIRNNVLLKGMTICQISRGVIYAFFILFLVNEFNHIIRYILAQIKLEPSIKSRRKKEIDKQELKRGKIIGIIERIMFFLFVITGNYSSIAFVLTAKGFTRFKELDNKNFAEYVLIGTLLSGSISIFWAQVALSIIK